MCLQTGKITPDSFDPGRRGLYHRGCNCVELVSGKRATQVVPQVSLNKTAEGADHRLLRSMFRILFGKSKSGQVAGPASVNLDGRDDKAIGYKLHVGTRQDRDRSLEWLAACFLVQVAQTSRNTDLWEDRTRLYVATN